MVRYLPFLISLALSVYALFSCIQTPDEDVPQLPKLVWIVLIVLVPFVGPITWLLMSRSTRRPAGRPSARRDGSPRPAPAGTTPRPQAPDDDPEFLAWLARQQRRRTGPQSPGPQAPDAGRGDTGPGDTGRGDTGRGDTGRGEPGHGTGRSDDDTGADGGHPGRRDGSGDSGPSGDETGDGHGDPPGDVDGHSD